MLKFIAKIELTDKVLSVNLLYFTLEFTYKLSKTCFILFSVVERKKE